MKILFTIAVLVAMPFAYASGSDYLDKQHEHNMACSFFKIDACQLHSNCGGFDKYDNCIDFYNKSTVCEDNKTRVLKDCARDLEIAWDTTDDLEEYCNSTSYEESCNKVK